MNIKENRLTYCPVCGGIEHQHLRDAFDDRYGNPAVFRLIRCNYCCHTMTSPRLSEADLPELYKSYYPRKALIANMVTRQATEAQASFAKVRRWWMGVDNQGQFNARRGERMLDVGCGSGFSLLVARNAGVDAYGVEADPNVSTLAKSLNLRIHIGSIYDVPFPEVSFDLVVLNQVIEHIPEPGKALDAIFKRLAPGGRIILVFPNRSSIYNSIFGCRWINWHIPYHQHHFNLSGFLTLAKKHGLRLVRHRTITPNLWTFLQLRAFRQKLSKGEKSSLWVSPANGAVNSAAEKRTSSLFNIIGLSIILGSFSLINRCIDVCGLGDSIMVELVPEKTH